jgi:hypothetical protein
MSINRFVVTGLHGSLPRTLVYRNDGQEDNVDLPVFWVSLRKLPV